MGTGRHPITSLGGAARGASMAEYAVLACVLCAVIGSVTALSGEIEAGMRYATCRVVHASDGGQACGDEPPRPTGPLHIEMDEVEAGSDSEGRAAIAPDRLRTFYEAAVRELASLKGLDPSQLGENELSMLVQGFQAKDMGRLLPLGAAPPAGMTCHANPSRREQACFPTGDLLDRHFGGPLQYAMAGADDARTFLVAGKGVKDGPQANVPEVRDERTRGDLTRGPSSAGSGETPREGGRSPVGESQDPLRNESGSSRRRRSVGFRPKVRIPGWPGALLSVADALERFIDSFDEEPEMPSTALRLRDGSRANVYTETDGSEVRVFIEIPGGWLGLDMWEGGTYAPDPETGLVYGTGGRVLGQVVDGKFTGSEAALRREAETIVGIALPDIDVSTRTRGWADQRYVGQGKWLRPVERWNVNTPGPTSPTLTRRIFNAIPGMDVVAARRLVKLLATGPLTSWYDVTDRVDFPETARRALEAHGMRFDGPWLVLPSIDLQASPETLKKFGLSDDGASQLVALREEYKQKYGVPLDHVGHLDRPVLIPHDDLRILHEHNGPFAGSPQERWPDPEQPWDFNSGDRRTFVHLGIRWEDAHLMDRRIRSDLPPVQDDNDLLRIGVDPASIARLRAANGGYGGAPFRKPRFDLGAVSIEELVAVFDFTPWGAQAVDKARRAAIKANPDRRGLDLAALAEQGLELNPIDLLILEQHGLVPEQHAPEGDEEMEPFAWF